jgi:hypothetical protein
MAERYILTPAIPLVTLTSYLVVTTAMSPCGTPVVVSVHAHGDAPTGPAQNRPRQPLSR